jgi:peptidoglycan/xylan/chitin deacetylase (PgdA/CDA1 family)
VKRSLTLAAAAVVSTAFVPAPSPGLITHGPRRDRLVALTFDADMTRPMLRDLRARHPRRWYDPALISELRANHVPTTVFLTGLWTLTYNRLARSLARDPLFEVENHSYNHAAWEAPCYGLARVRSQAMKREEVTGTAKIIRRVTGVRPSYFRFPGGCQHEADIRLVQSLGEQPVQWDVISGDAFMTDPSRVAQHVLTQVRPGSIVVMHFIGAPKAPATAAALRQIIPALRRRGFRFVTLRTLLHPKS